MSERHVSRIGRLTALCLLVAAVVTIGLAIAGALKGGRSAGASARIAEMTGSEARGRWDWGKEKWR
jgi:hypothetical protein